jgi:hypothetical protein
MMANDIQHLASDTAGNLYATVWRDDHLRPYPGGPPALYFALYRSIDEGTSWSLLKDSVSPEIVTDPYGGIYVTATSQRPKEVFRSTDRGDSWMSFEGGGPIAFNRTGTIAIGGVGAYVSGDSGRTWRNRGPIGNVYSTAVAANGNIFAASYDWTAVPTGYMLSMSRDAGLNWDTLPDNRFVSSISLGASSTGDVYATDVEVTHSRWPIYRMSGDGTDWKLLTDSFRVESFQFDQRGDIFINSLNSSSFTKRSTDRGDSWQQLPGWLSGMTTYGSRDICAILSDNNAQQGLYRSADLGDNWMRIDGAINSYRLISPVYTPSGDLYVATDQGGIFRASGLAGVRIAAGRKAQELWLGQNSPNPISDITTIPFRLPIAGHVTLRVHDLLGREMATLLDGKRPAGGGEVRFDSGDLESGTYLIVLDDGKDRTSQVVVVRH